MKSANGPSKMKILYLLMLSVIIITVCYVYHNFDTYNSIDIVIDNIDAVEYGSPNYDVEKLIKDVEGKIVSVDLVDTTIVGNQEVIVNIEKDNMIKQIPIVVSVVDTTAPVIELKEEKVTINYGETYDFNNNIKSVHDDIEGDLPYIGEELENKLFYYNFSFDAETIYDSGEHEVKVIATDRNGNTTDASFILEVLKPKPVYVAPIYSNIPGNAHGGDLISLAYSYVGYPYISGANGPYGFDCSGFVQYLYSRMGIYISRSTSTQLYDGVAVSYENAQPGDILLWGYSEGSPTHSALYVGGGQMVHATNPRQGVLASDVAAWTRGSGTHVIAVRRIP